MDYKERIKADALVAVNEIRVRKGMAALRELPQGIKADSQQCVLARALGSPLAALEDELYSCQDVWYLPRAEKHTKPVFRALMHAFDMGQLPELDMALLAPADIAALSELVAPFAADYKAPPALAAPAVVSVPGTDAELVLRSGGGDGYA